jgi:hypothetical protein
LSKLIFWLLLLVSVVSIAGFAQAAAKSINIEPGKEYIQTIDLLAEDRTQITFTILGSTTNTIHFYIVFPNGTTRDYGEISQYSTYFADVKGTCELHFDNANSSNSVLVSLNYEVEHYIFGIAPILFALIAVAAAAACITAGYIIMGKYSPPG